MIRQFHWILVSLVFFSLLTSTCLAVIRHVPSTYATIQIGINAAENGDTVLISNGTYEGTGNVNLDTNGKAITIKSANGFDSCKILCSSSDRGFYLTDGETTTTVISGLAITLGDSANYGGGIYLNNAGATIENCYFDSCSSGYGGALAIAGTNTGVVIKDCYFQANTAVGQGGSIFVDTQTSDILITGCTFQDNEAASGGAVCVYHSDNTEITNCRFRNNNALTSHAGAVYVHSSNNTITNCLFRFNFAESATGGGAYCAAYSSSGQLQNCSFTGNKALNSIDGGAILAKEGSSVIVGNSILWNDDPNEIAAPSGNIVIVIYSDVEGGWGTPSDHNINLDPLFVTGTEGYCYLSHIATGHSFDSPCINTGSTSSSSVCMTVAKLDECLDTYSTRIDGGFDTGDVDMGYHFTGVPPTPTPTNTPTPTPRIIHVPDDYTTIQSAIDAAEDGETVLVHDGTYSGAGNYNLDTKGKEILVISETGPQSCVLQATSCNRLFTFNSSETISTVVRGFTLTQGDATLGGAILCEVDSSPVVVNCIIHNNNATQYGGAVYVSDSVLRMVNCLVYDNTATLDAGAIEVTNYGSVYLTNCTLSGNSSGSTCGGINVTGASSNAYLMNCILWNDDGNEIAGNGTATYCDIAQRMGVFPGTGNINANPEWISGSYGTFYLNPSPRVISPCIDSGNGSSSTICFAPDTTQCLDNMTTSPDNSNDYGTVDMGFHYQIAPCLNHGDVDNNGVVTSGDAQLTFQIALLMITPTWFQECAADCIADDTVTVGDAQQVFLAGLGMDDCADPV